MAARVVRIACWCFLFWGIWGPAGATEVELVPGKVNLDSAGATFSVDVTIHNVLDLMSFSFEIHYDPSVVYVDDSDPNSVQMGPFLGSTGESFFEVGPTIDNTAGKVVFGATLLGSNPDKPDGDGVLATVTFTVADKHYGHLDLQNVELYRTVSEAIPVDSVTGTRLIAPSTAGYLPGIYYLLLYD